jgi:perosamine synthetase
MIPVYQPDLSGNERAYVLDCLDSSWISSIGSYITRFEDVFARTTGIPHSLTVANGTVALHLALHCLDIGPGDEVIVPTFTYIASVNTIAQTGAKPVFVDCRESDWLIDPVDITRKITTKTKAIMPVHLYGGVADMPTIMKIARENDLKVVEDCAEALGSSLNGVHVGAFGDIGTFSFFGNKTVTTGEGGMVATTDKALAARMRKAKGQGQSLHKRYWHDELGFNYRMTNICAAIGLAQMERLQAILARKRFIADTYRRELANTGVVMQEKQPGVSSSDWLVSLLVPRGTDRYAVMDKMRAAGVDTRPVFYCAHHMPMYKQDTIFRVSEEISNRGISLPSFPTLSDDQLAQVIGSLKSAIRK